MVYENSTEKSTSNIAFPVPRAQMSIGLMGNPPVNIIIYGGRTLVDGQPELLEDMWSFSTYSNKWRQVFPNSELPSKRAGASLVVVFRNNCLDSESEQFFVIIWWSLFQ